MKLAFLYAGQGSQHVGMGRDLYEAYPAFRQVLDSAPVDFDLKSLCFDGPEEQLNDTRYTQPCMVAFAAGVTALLKQAGIVPEYAAGLSLGEYSALQCAGVFDAPTAISLVAFRGQAMASAVQGRPCGMAAVLGMDRESLKAVCEQASDAGVVECTAFRLSRAWWSAPTSTAPGRSSSPGMPTPWTRPVIWPRPRGPSGCCP